MLKKLIFLIALWGTARADVLLWDLGGELFHPNKWGVASEIGLRHFLAYTLFDWGNPNIQRLVFDVLDLLEKPGEKHLRGAATAEDMPLPVIMCKWQAGTLLGPQIIKIARAHIDRLYKRGYFKSKREAQLIKRTVTAMFDPEILAANIVPVKKGVRLLQACTRVKNKDGSPRHKNIAFSNWDPLSFAKFSKRYQWIFNYFDDVIISGNIGLIKPHRAAFEYVMKKCKLNPQRERIYLIDDQTVNAQAAKEFGIETILVKDYDYRSLHKQFLRLNILAK